MIKEELSKILEEIISETLSDYRLYCRVSNRIINLTESSFQTEGYNKPDYFMTFHAKQNKAFREYDYSKLDFILKNDFPFLIKGIKNRFGPTTLTGERIIEVLSVNVISRIDSKENIHLTINRVIDEFLNSIEKKKIHLNVFIPVRNLSLDDGIEIVDLGNNFFIKKLTESEIEMLFLDRTYDLDLSDICRYSILFNSDEDLIYDDTTIEPRSGDNYLDDEINKIIYSLNITSKGSLGYEGKYYFYDDIFKYFFHNRATRSFKKIIGSAPKLNKESIDKWKHFYKYLSEIDYTPFMLSFRKLQEAETRHGAEDSIIDAVIGLESLLLNEVGNEATRGEMKYRFCINYASLFPHEQKDEAYHTAAAAYDLRSVIVHGGKIDKNKIKFGKTFLSLYDSKMILCEMLRVCIRFLLEKPINKNFNSKGFWLNKVLHNDNEHLTRFPSRPL